jgi:hypothetical protein
MIPVLLLLTALVLDVGNWYTHKRQLQNRADAAAFAAGVSYAKNWKACVQNTDAAVKLAASQSIANTARQYAADPEASDYTPASPPASLYNENIADQSKLDVVVNSTDYTNNTDNSDGGDPCFLHPADANDPISPAGGVWTDVKVKERDLRSLVGSIGLPLSQNGARARVEIHPAISGTRFLPLAIPNNAITQVQVRYFDECRDPSHQNPLLVQDLKPLPDADQTAWTAKGGGILWGVPSSANPNVGSSTTGVDLTLPVYDASCGDYLPIGVQVRLVARDEVNINAQCSTLISADFADCFTRISQIRLWNDGNADNFVRVTNVRLTGGCTDRDAYFGRPAVGSTQCAYGVSADINWGTRPDGNKAIVNNFTVSANGAVLQPTAGAAGINGTWTTTGSPITANPGANPVTMDLAWSDKDSTHSWQGSPCSGNTCTFSVNGMPVHRAFVGNRQTAGAVVLVRTSLSTFVTAVPGPRTRPAPAIDNAPGAGPITNCNARKCTIFPTVATQSVLRTGVLTTLRLDDPQGNQTVQCDPLYANQGQEFATFRFGCSPWYRANEWDNDKWWSDTFSTTTPPTPHCPPSNLWFGTGNMGTTYGTNSARNAWECLQTAPGLSTPVIGEGLSVATDNCSVINNNNCQTTSCLVDGNYDGKANPKDPADPGWKYRVNGLGSRDPRVVNLFIIPYQALKTAGGADPTKTVPILSFASFYVMNWTGSNAQNSDPCPDPDFNGTPVPNPPAGAAVGVFVEGVDYEPGPVDETAQCVEGQLGICRAVLVR